MKATVNLDGLHRLASMHRRAILKAKRIGCFYCCGFSKTGEIKEWIDVREVRKGVPPGPQKMSVLLALPKVKEGQTAMCPKCGIDSVLPDRSYGFRLTKELLAAMRAAWFGPPRRNPPSTRTTP